MLVCGVIRKTYISLWGARKILLYGRIVRFSELEGRLKGHALKPIKIGINLWEKHETLF